MKIIFLDVDGVLNAHLSSDAPPHTDEEKIALLADIIHSTDAKLVIHSGWRFWLDEQMRPTTEEMRLLLESLERYHITVYDKTPDFADEEIMRTKYFSLVKAKEILAWLNEHDNVENYVVLEDLELYDDAIKAHQVQTQSQIGLTREKAAEAAALLCHD